MTPHNNHPKNEKIAAWAQTGFGWREGDNHLDGRGPNYLSGKELLQKQLLGSPNPDGEGEPSTGR